MKKEKIQYFLINNNKSNILKYDYKTDNTVRLAKYNFLTFFPKSLMIQFMRLANIYFLIIAVIQSIPTISPLNPITAIAPLIIVLAGSMLREGWEDLKRHKFDKMLNNETVLIYSAEENRWVKSKSKDIRIGEFVVVNEDETCPSDLILLDSNHLEGYCFIETADLDGEKTLKKRIPNSKTIGMFNNGGKYPDSLPMITGEVSCDPPNFELYRFEGKMELKNEEKSITISLNQKQIILKGSKLRNTKWVLGLSAYVGHNCKMIKNTKSPKNKISNTDRLVSRFVLGILFIQIGFCITSAVFNSVYSKDLTNHHYLYLTDSDSSILAYFTYLLLFNTMIPISLIITMEVVKIAQGIFMGYDVNLYCKLRKSPPKIGSVSLNEELGQVTHIFSDKTGTLTQNKMVFKYSIIGDSTFEITEKDLSPIQEINQNVTNHVSKAISKSLINSNANLPEIPKNRPVKLEGNFGYEKEMKEKESDLLTLKQNNNNHIEILTKEIYKQSGKMEFQNVTMLASSKAQKLEINISESKENKDNIEKSKTQDKDNEQKNRISLQNKILNVGDTSPQANLFSKAKLNNQGKTMSVRYKKFLSIYKRGISAGKKKRISGSSKPGESGRQISIRDLEHNFKILSRKSTCVEPLKIGPGFMVEDVQEIYNKYLIQSRDKKITLDLSTQGNKIYHYWCALALANECIVEKKNQKDKERPSNNGKKILNFSYSGMSPDDVELVYTSARQGYELTFADHRFKRLNVGINSQTRKEFKVLQILEFTSDRKKMSIIVKDMLTGNYFLYSKGADSVILSSLAIENSASIIDTNTRLTSFYSKQGYRTLSVAMKIFSKEEYEEIEAKLAEANLVMDGRASAVEKVYNSIEKDLFLLGSTVVEDKLQDQVPETIRDLRISHIKIWMLTGDKIDTAYSISLSCNLITPKMKTFIINGEKGDTIEKLVTEFRYFVSTFKEDDSQPLIRAFSNANDHSQYEAILRNFRSNSVLLRSFTQSYENDAKIVEKVNDNFSIVIDSKAISNILANEDQVKVFVSIALKAYAVVCCRISPLQKSEIVRVVNKLGDGVVSLSIGDGGNDVSMILEANIGVGIYGEEGMRAVQASDFALGEFKILRYLLLQSGRLNNYRISNMILYFFYKNFVLTIIHFFYGFSNNFSGQTIIDDWFIALYNMVITALPLCIVAVFDIDLMPGDSIVIDKLLPFLFTDQRDNPILNSYSFSREILRAIGQGALIFYLSTNSLVNLAINSQGSLADLWFFSMNIYSIIIFAVSIRLLISVRYFSSIIVVVMGCFSWLLYIFCLILSQRMTLFNSVGTTSVAFSSFNFFLSLLLIVGACFIVDFAINSFYFNFYQNLNHLISYDLELIQQLSSKTAKGSNGSLEKLPLYIGEMLDEYVEYEIEIDKHFNNIDEPNRNLEENKEEVKTEQVGQIKNVNRNNSNKNQLKLNLLNIDEEKHNDNEKDLRNIHKSGLGAIQKPSLSNLQNHQNIGSVCYNEENSQKRLIASPDRSKIAQLNSNIEFKV